MNSTQTEIPLIITGQSHDGRGIAHHQGKTVFINGAIMGEEVTCRITKKHSRYEEADVVSVITPSPQRTVPLCPHFALCGGCSLQHMNMEAQLQMKQKTLLEQLKHFGNVVPEKIDPPMTGNLYGYRRKARLGVRFVKKKERVLVGFREKSSRFLADIRTCSVLHPTVGTHIQDLAELINSLSEREHIPQVEVAVGDDATALIFRHLTPLSQEDKEKLVTFGQQFHFHIYLQPGSPNSLEKIWPNDKNQKLIYSLPDFSLEMIFHPLDFVQINGEMNRLLIQKALTLLELQPNDHVLDLFCGLGNFSLAIAKFAKQVTGVEGSLEMVERAKMNAEHNKLLNTDFHAANLMENINNAPWLKQYDKILLDPPRAGAKEVIHSFEKINAQRLVYVSCNPATLARDAGILVYTYQYRLKQVGIVNMFPHTSHIEAIALFEK